MSLDSHFFLIKYRCAVFYAEEIQYHLQSISEYIDKKIVGKAAKKLHDETLWYELKKNDLTIEKLHNSFKRQITFAHLSAQEILQLKDEHIDILEYMLDSSLNALIQDYNNFKQYGLRWFPLTDKNYRATINHLKTQQAFLQKLNKDFQEACLLRADLHTLVDIERHYDDVVGIFSRLVNTVASVEPPLTVVSPMRAGLDDDTRVELFDWCMKSGSYDKDAVKKFITPINQNPYELPLNAHEIADENNELLKWCKKIKTKYNLTISERCNTQKTTTKEVKANWFKKMFFKPMRNFLPSNSLRTFLMAVYQKRYWIALAITLLLHVFISPIVVTASVLYFGQWSAVIASNLFFYGVTLLPLWVLSINLYHKGIKALNLYISFRKIEKIQIAVERLKFNQKYITNRLSKGILDIPHFNIDILDQTVQKKISEIEKLIKALKHERVYEKILPNYSINQSVKEAIEKLEIQKKSFNNRLEILSMHIAERIKDEMLIFKKNCNKEMVPRISKKQANRLRHFVKKYGSVHTLALFDKNIDIIPTFLEAIENKKFCFKDTKEKICNQPWGGHRLKLPTIYGWAELIKQMFLSVEKRQAALAIVDIIGGKKTVTFDELKYILSAVQMNNSSSRWYNALINHLFLTLDQMPPFMGRILNFHKKKLIHDWYKNNKNNIQKAYDYFSMVMSRQDLPVQTLNDETLSFYFALLRGAEIAYYSGITSNKIMKFKNNMENYFSYYDGSHSKAIYYTLFIPDDRKKDIIYSIASKRLEWLLNNTERVLSIEKSDIELFKSPFLHKDDSSFDFNEFIINHPLYLQTWNSNIQKFLKLCKNSGLNSEQTLLHYKLVHQREKNRVEPNYLKTAESKSSVDLKIS